MTKALLATSFLALASASYAATIIDAWDFTYSDGTGLAAALSNNGTNLGSNSAAVSVQGNGLEFGYDAATASTFRTTNLSTDPLTSGQVQVSWTVTTASMVNTDAVDGQARVGFNLRDADPTTVDVAFVRVMFDGDDYVLQYTDSISSNVTVATFSGNALSDLDIRYVVDLSNTGSVGSFQLFYTLGAGSEVAAVTNGVIGTGLVIDEFRTVQQITNGGTNWQSGDTMVIDDLVVSVIPEPSAALIGGLGLLGLLRRRR